MAIGAHHYLDIANKMSQEERDQLTKSVEGYDDNTRRKIIKAHMDAKAVQLGIVDNSSNKKGTTIPEVIREGNNFRVGNQIFTSEQSAKDAVGRISGLNRPSSADVTDNKISAQRNTELGMKKVGTLFKRKPVISKMETTPMMSTTNGPVAGNIIKGGTIVDNTKINPIGGTIDNQITNNLVNKGLLPESQRENIPQITQQKKGFMDKTVRDIVSPYTTEQLAKAEADDLAMRQGVKNVVKKITPTPYTTEQLAKAEADDLAMRNKIGGFIKNIFKPYNFTEQVKNKK